MYGQPMGGGVNLQSPEEIAQQQARWEKERAENDKRSYQSQVTHMALMLMTGNNSSAYTHETALRTAHLLLQGAKTYTP